MVGKICLDTDFCIAVLNNEERADKLLNFIGSRSIFVTSITIFELYLRKENLEKIRTFINDSFILKFDQEAAIIASDIYKDLKSKGIIIDYRDIFIASIAITNNCSLATFNKKHFLRIKNLELLG